MSYPGAFGSANLDGWLTTVTDAKSKTTTYGYDDMGRITGMTDFASRQTTYSYNRAGWRTGEERKAGRSSICPKDPPKGRMKNNSPWPRQRSPEEDNRTQLDRRRKSRPEVE